MHLNQLTNLMKKLFAQPLFLSVAFVVLILFGISGYYFEIGFPAWVTMLIGLLIGILLLFLLRIIFSKLIPLLGKIPASVYATLLTGFVALYLMRMYAFRWPASLFYALAVFGLICCGLLIWGIWKILAKTSVKWGAVMIIGALVLAAVGVYGFSTLDGDPFSKETDGQKSEVAVTTLAEKGLDNPSSLGTFEVETFTYGSGTDQKRTEYAKGVKIKTSSVDASLLLPDWKDKKKKWREKFWGFGVKEFPLNGRVYMPKGDGPFPLVLVVHGNHSMIDYSDAGYAYLGELLASRGTIMVSVDENFVNAHWSGDFRGKEMPVRGWLLLKHLEQWEQWNKGGNAELKGKVDMDNIVLIGHSRGGEAVSIAAAFNKLSRFPDNAKEEFDFGFGIKGVVTIAPTDYRYDREMELEDVNYLSLQGAWDSDETSFWGMRPYHRLKFSEGFNGFKAGLYMNHANHGQFNSTWGRSDFGAPMEWLLNLKPLVTGEEQRQVAKVYVSAFVEAVLKGNKVYIPIFKNSELAGEWLPKEDYFSQYADTSKKILLDFEEDMDVASSKDGIKILAENFKVWREEQLKSRDGGSQQNNALVLGWRYGKKSIADSIASYTIVLPDSLKNFETADTLALSLALGNFSELKNKSDKEKKDEAPDHGFNFSVVLTDSLDRTASVDLGMANNLPKTIKSKFTKFKFLDKDMIGQESEIQLKSCYLPISLFKVQNDSLYMDKLKSIKLVFGKDSLGIVVLDDLGFYLKP